MPSPHPRHVTASERSPERRAVEPAAIPPTPIEIVDGVIADALARRASDIHLEPNAAGMRVRLRVDGFLQDAGEIALEHRASAVSRVKILARLDIAEHRLPQDGRFRLGEGLQAVDIRVSVTPSLHGEKVVMRVLDLDKVGIPIGSIGLAPEELAQFSRLIRRPQGVIFVTGPTGSGKTSTIYGALNEINGKTINIVTIEDPIEYEMDGITQIAVHDRIGLTFAHCLRSVLRQDPDVILVGEVRDVETARITMQASLTGHLVFATLHANDAVGAVTRLLDMGIPPYLIGSAVVAVLSQRLVRLLCACRRSAPPEAVAGGCAQCRGTGVLGRTGIFELLPMTPELRELITAQAPEAVIRAAARRSSVHSMFTDGLRKVTAGLVAYEEILRVAEPDPPPRHAGDAGS